LPALAREVAAQKPRNAEFHMVLGDGMMAAGKRPEAIQAYERAIQLSSKPVRALRALAAALSAFDKAIRLNPQEAAYFYGSALALARVSRFV
jgi:cytochrome c-type biogenesis protein CcmH/NrfG